MFCGASRGRSRILYPHGVKRRLAFPDLCGYHVILSQRRRHPYYHSKVYHELKRRFPDLKLFIVGANPPTRIRALADDPSIIVTGFVADVRPYFARASVFIAPFVSGQGIKTKVIEAMAMGKPVVSTSLGAQGINAIGGDHLYIADSPTAFANRVTELLLDDVKRKTVGCRARVCRKEAFLGARER